MPVPVDLVLEVAGPYAEGFGSTTADCGSPLWPEETRALHDDFYQRYPDEPRYALDNAVSPRQEWNISGRTN